MKNSNSQLIGGLVLKSEDLIEIINEPGAIGLAFGLERPGYSPNVNLVIYKVFKRNNHMFGHFRKIENRKGAVSVDEKTATSDSFRFQYSKELESSGFDFAYLDKEVFNKITKNKEPEVFIAGALKNFGDLVEANGEWFTLTITPRRGLRKEENKVKDLGVPPTTHFMPPCPPIWDREIKRTEGWSGNNSPDLIFIERIHADSQ